MLVVTILMLAFIILLAWAWVRGIDNMNNNHPDYDGDDLFDENNKQNKDHGQ